MFYSFSAGINFIHENRMSTEQDSPRAVKVNPFRSEFTIVIFIHYKPRIAVAILHL